MSEYEYDVGDEVIVQGKYGGSGIVIERRSDQRYRVRMRALNVWRLYLADQLRPAFPKITLLEPEVGDRVRVPKWNLSGVLLSEVTFKVPGTSNKAVSSTFYFLPDGRSDALIVGVEQVEWE